jgi:hypothetical protein
VDGAVAHAGAGNRRQRDTLDFAQAVVSWPWLQIDADVRSGNPALVAKPGILVSTDDLAIRSSTVKVRAPCGTGMPVMFRIDVSGTAGNGNITVRPPRPPRRTLWKWLGGAPAPMPSRPAAPDAARRGIQPLDQRAAAQFRRSYGPAGKASQAIDGPRLWDLDLGGDGAPGASGRDVSCFPAAASARAATSSGKSAGCPIARAKSHPWTKTSAIRTPGRSYGAQPRAARAGGENAAPGAGQPAEDTPTSQAPAKSAKPAATAGAVGYPEDLLPAQRPHHAGGRHVKVTGRCPHRDRYGHDWEKCAMGPLAHLARERGAKVL